MDIGIVSMRYAKALMEYAKSMGAEDTLYKEFCMLDRSFRKHPDLRMTVLPPCCMPAWSCRLKWIPPLKVVLSSTSTTSVWMPVLLRSLRK